MMALAKKALLSSLLVAFAPGIIQADPIEKKGTAPYVTHFIFRPVQSLEVSRSRHSHLAGGSRNHAEHEGREDV